MEPNLLFLMSCISCSNIVLLLVLVVPPPSSGNEEEAGFPFHRETGREHFFFLTQFFRRPTGLALNAEGWVAFPCKSTTYRGPVCLCMLRGPLFHTFDQAGYSAQAAETLLVVSTKALISFSFF